MIVQTDQGQEVAIVPVGAEVVPGYVVIAHVRRGHRLDVYDAWSTRREARCVVKVVRPDRIGEPHTSFHLRREGEMLLDLAHPHLVRAYEVVQEPQVAVVLETLTGPSLETVLDTRGRLAPSEVALLGCQVASGLRFLHLHECVHGDVAVGNIILEAGVAKIIDLSLSGPPGPVRAGSGTRGYRAPEQESGERQTPATDVWGLGAVLHHALWGHTHDEVARHRLYRRLSLATGRRSRAEIGRVVDCCLRRDPASRLSVEGLAARLGQRVDLRVI